MRVRVGVCVSPTLSIFGIGTTCEAVPLSIWVRGSHAGALVEAISRARVGSSTLSEGEGEG